MRKLLLACLLSLLPACFAATLSVPDSLLQGLHAYTLSNGLSLLVNETPSDALVQLAFVCRAGYGSQDAANAGFPELYARLFTSTARNCGMEAEDITVQFNADRALFAATVGSEQLEQHLHALAACARRPSFRDEDIASQYESLKNRIAAYQGSDAGFINGAIEVRLFPQSPWKESFGINSRTFSSYTEEQVKTQLLAVWRNYYTPDNCALFVSGNVDGNTVYSLVQGYFGSWRGSSACVSRAAQAGAAARRRFVISAPSFSPSLTQLVVQFTSLHEAEADVLSAAFSAADSPYRERILSRPELAVQSGEHLACSRSTQLNGTRFILQAVADSSAPPDADLFVQEAKQAARLSPARLEAAENAVISDFLSRAGNDGTLTALLADVWTLHPELQAAQIADYIIEEKRSLGGRVTCESLAAAVAREEPFVFVLVNDAVYERAKADFTRKGYEHIVRESATWYDDGGYTVDSPASEAAVAAKAPSETGAYSSYYVANARTLSSARLSNGIPITVKANGAPQTAAISVAIAGGETQGSAGQRRLRTVLVNLLADGIQSELQGLREGGGIAGNVDVRAWTTEAASYISLECLKAEFGAVLEAAARAIGTAELQPLLADRRIAEQKELWLQQTADPSFRLRARAMQELYAGSGYAGLYELSAPVLQESDFHVLSRAYSELRDASLYSLVLVGDFDPQTARQEAERSFGALKAQGAAAAPAIPRPQELRARSLSVAGNPAAGSPPLVQLHFPAPAYGTQRELFNALLFELAALVQERLGAVCTGRAATGTVQSGMMETQTGADGFVEAFAAAREQLRRELADDAASPARLRSIRSAWNAGTLIKTRSNSGTAELIQDGLLSGQAGMYLDSFLVVSHATGADFLRILEAYFPAVPPLTVSFAEPNSE